MTTAEQSDDDELDDAIRAYRRAQRRNRQRGGTLYDSHVNDMLYQLEQERRRRG